MAYSCNNNQNYFIQGNRTTSRVSQPPGGASSLSLGGYGGAAPAQNVKRNSIVGSRLSQVLHSEKVPQDSLGELVRRKDESHIPGLENHYIGRKGGSGIEAAVSRSFQQTGPLSAKEYSALLKYQIDSNRVLKESMQHRSENFPYHRTNAAILPSSSYDGGLYKEKQSKASLSARSLLAANSFKSSAQLSSGRIQQPPGGTSSLSLGWD